MNPEREPGQGLRPALLEIVDGPAVVGAVLRREAQDLDLALALLGGAPHPGVEALYGVGLDVPLHEVLPGAVLLRCFLAPPLQDLL